MLGKLTGKAIDAQMQWRRLFRVHRPGNYKQINSIRKNCLMLLGFSLENEELELHEITRINLRIGQRKKALVDKNWAEADRIRDELLAQGIQLKDGKDPETGERVTTWEVVR